MKILHVNTDESLGGAARAAHRLYAGQRSIGEDARMAVLRKSSKDPHVDVVPMNRLQRLIRRKSLHNDRPDAAQYPGYHGMVWSRGRISTPVPAFIARTQPDVVNLHWLGNGFVSVDSLTRIPRPVVWTLHDMWAITGGCHYAGDCERYLSGCGACPQLASGDPRDISFQTWANKVKTWSDLRLTVVTPSRWLADLVRASPLLHDQRIEVIPNGIDTQIYRPFDMAFARDVMRLPTDKKLILFGAQQVDDARKGLSHLAQALSRLRDRDDVELVLFGANHPLVDVGLKAHHVGQIENDQVLALLYSAVDVFVAPSVQDNLPNTVMEALACGTPCVAFHIGGMHDMIDHQQSGYLAKPFDAADLAHGLEWTMANRAALVGHARTEAAARYDIVQIAARYVALYAEVISEQAGSGS